MILLLIFLAIPLFIFFFIKHKNNNNEPYNPPPGPKGLPIIGNLHQLDLLQPHVYFANLAKTHGPTLSLRFGSVPAVVVHSAKAAKEIMHTKDLNFCYRPQKMGSRKLSYNGLDLAFAHSVDHFREIKKLCVVHLLSNKKVESLARIRQEEVLSMINKVSSLSSTSEIVNLSEVLMSFSSSHICRTAFGKRYVDDEGSKRSRFYRLLHDAEVMLFTFFFADHFPYLGWLDKLTGQLSKLEKTYKDLDAFYDEIIDDHLDPNRLESEQEDFIDVLLRLRKHQAFTLEFTLHHIKAILMNIFLAGTSTTAAVVVWAITELIKNPTSMKKVQQELRNSTPNNKGYISIQDLSNLQYLKAVVKETLRFHPPAPLLIVREAIEKCTVQGYDILPKTLVFINAWVIGKDPESWKDPEIFMPERFMESSIDYKGQDFEYVPFGAGRKMCPGMLLGVGIVELALANLLYSFDWELPKGMKVEDIDMDTLPGITMHKKNPLCLMARKYA